MKMLRSAYPNPATFSLTHMPLHKSYRSLQRPIYVLRGRDQEHPQPSLPRLRRACPARHSNLLARQIRLDGASRVQGLHLAQTLHDIHRFPTIVPP